MKINRWVLNLFEATAGQEYRLNNEQLLNLELLYATARRGVPNLGEIPPSWNKRAARYGGLDPAIHFT